MSDKKRTLWLAVALGVTLIVAWFVWSGNDAAVPAPPQRASAPRTNTQPDAPAPPADVNLEVLTAARNEPAASGRNPFRFRARPAPAPDTAQRLPGVPDDQVDAPQVARGPEGPPEPPPIALKFIGLVQKADGTKIAVLSDGRGPISGGEGDEIEGRYKILRIGSESIDIAYLDGRGKRTIRLNGQ
jgi:hypothetical protein